MPRTCSSKFSVAKKLFETFAAAFASAIERPAISLAAWKGCKSLPLIQKTSARQERKSYAQAATKTFKNDGKIEEKATEATEDITDLKASINALKEVKTVIQEFPTLLEAAPLCRKAKSENEKPLLCLTHYWANKQPADIPSSLPHPPGSSTTQQCDLHLAKVYIRTDQLILSTSVKLNNAWPMLLAWERRLWPLNEAVRFVKPIIALCVCVSHLLIPLSKIFLE
ncbi:hypothetical protein AVEN_234952-1 [Araneus ventricosus]|uniref:Uncharacterized protein n=1 Tax=Araneus ventricosus TaxID=182803 RepID=A0A4Y2FNQ6_ARAVE|nr:hypothetical protein AVEN_234952-1 [Araneus ventricosus]